MVKVEVERKLFSNRSVNLLQIMSNKTEWYKLCLSFSGQGRVFHPTTFVIRFTDFFYKILLKTRDSLWEGIKGVKRWTRLIFSFGKPAKSQQQSFTIQKRNKRTVFLSLCFNTMFEELNGRFVKKHEGSFSSRRLWSNTNNHHTNQTKLHISTFFSFLLNKESI